MSLGTIAQGPLRRAVTVACFSALMGLGALPARGQVSAMPPSVREVLEQVGPRWGEDISGNIARTRAAYEPLLRAVPTEGVTVSRDLAYGPYVEQRLDLYRRVGISGAPVVVFVHGGAYVAGARNDTETIYGNIATFFAREGMLGVNADYRLAPESPWPAGAEDVAGIVAWLHENAARYGGDSNRIFLIGHSAGATHVAGYAFDPTFHPRDEGSPGRCS